MTPPEVEVLLAQGFINLGLKYTWVLRRSRRERLDSGKPVDTPGKVEFKELWVWGHGSIIPAPWRRKQEDQKFKGRP